MARFCSNCGNEIKAGSKFCNKCGNPVQAADIHINSDLSSRSSVEESFKEISVDNVAERATASDNVAIDEKKVLGNSKFISAAVVIASLIVSSLGSYFFFANQISQGAGSNVPVLTDVDNVPVTAATVLRDMATIIAKGEVNMRATPTTNSSSVGVVREGDQVEVLEKSICNDSSAAIIVNDDIYYSNGKNKITLGKGKPVQIISEGNGICNVSFNVNGSTVTVQGNSNYFRKLYGTTWYKINGNGYTGWIFSDYARMN